MKVVIIGSGIAGLMAARTCHQAGFDVTVYEKTSHYGGHALTDYRDLGEEVFPFEVGTFMFDPVSIHPRMFALAKELGMTPTEIATSTTHEVPEKGIFWTSESSLPYAIRPLSIFLSVLKNRNWRKNLKYMSDIYRFYNNTEKISKEHPLRNSDMKTLDASGEFGEDLFNHWLYPHMLCWWGVPAHKAPECSVDVITDSMHRVSNNPQYVFKEGWHAFIEKIVAPFQGSLKLGMQVEKVRRNSTGVEIKVNGKKELFDHAIFAIAPSEVSKLLDSPDPEETSLLSNFETVTTDVYFHTDASWMPKKTSWGLINFTKDARGNFVTFWHGKLQKDHVPYFITWGDSMKEVPDSDKTVKKARMLRTLPTMGYRNNTCGFNEIQGKGHIWHCGAHVDSIVSTNHMPVPSVWHENAFLSGVNVANKIIQSRKRGHSHVG